MSPYPLFRDTDAGEQLAQAIHAVLTQKAVDGGLAPQLCMRCHEGTDAVAAPHLLSCRWIL